MDAFVRNLNATICRHHLITATDRTLVALSGGADSVALLRGLLALEIPVEAAHCNFHLRGEASEADEQFCRTLCRQLGVTLHVAHFSTATDAEAHGVSIEMEARNARYDYFKKILAAHALTLVAIAHHRDDQAETLLLNLTRGTGLRGVGGMALHSGQIIRPMLHMRRSDAEAYLERIGQSYVTDQTNTDTAFHRNRIRHCVVPELCRINPRAVENLSDDAARLREAYHYYIKGVEATLTTCTTHNGSLTIIDIDALMANPAPTTLLYEALHPFGFSPAIIAQIAESLSPEPRTGALYNSPNAELLIDRNRLLIRPTDVSEDMTCLPLTLPTDNATICINPLGTLTLTRRPYTGPADIEKNNPNVATIDADRITAPLRIERAQGASHFYPYGMKGRKKVSDFLTDLKFSRFERERQLMLTSSDQLVWLVGLRPDARYALTASSTTLLRIEWHPHHTPVS